MSNNKCEKSKDHCEKCKYSTDKRQMWYQHKKTKKHNENIDTHRYISEKHRYILDLLEDKEFVEFEINEDFYNDDDYTTLKKFILKPLHMK